MKLQGPENCGGFSHGGQSFAVDKKGCISIPDDDTDAIEAARSHGFVPAKAKKASDPEVSE